jgi:hypothetical protein
MHREELASADATRTTGSSNLGFIGNAPLAVGLGSFDLLDLLETMFDYFLGVLLALRGTFMIRLELTEEVTQLVQQN